MYYFYLWYYVEQEVLNMKISETHRLKRNVLSLMWKELE
jgi:hypothetical protein